jgi:hypothetical protein
MGVHRNPVQQMVLVAEGAVQVAPGGMQSEHELRWAGFLATFMRIGQPVATVDLEKFGQ